MARTDIETLRRDHAAAHEAFACRLFCCSSTGCASSGCGAVMQAVHNALTSHGLGERVDVVPTGCMGLCSLGPLLRVEVAGQRPVLYKEVDALLARLILAEYVIPAVRGERELDAPPEYLREYELSLELPFFTRQQQVVLANNGHIDPDSIEDYLVRDGYRAFRKVLADGQGESVIETILASGLRGRGGAGYPTGQKWRFGRSNDGEPKYIICNGDEGDPGAYMDRSILEGDPHAVLEGMLIGGYAIGASQGWFYIRAEYPLAVERVERAIKQARRVGLLGKDILGSGFDFDCQVRLGAGAFVCGEETALLQSIEGLRGAPRPRPPYPSQKGLWGKPTVINNVETLANVAPIIRNGAEWFSGIGTKQSTGTKVFALTGKATHTGLIEVPMGMSLREIVEQIAGGVEGGKALKAVQTGGPSGGVIPADRLDIPVSFEDLEAIGSIMGSGGMIVLDEDDDMVKIAAFYLGFTVEESCGKCAPCRIGGTQMLTLLNKVLDGKANYDDLDAIRRLAHAMEHASLCGLGQTAANPVVSTLQFFEDEYTDRILAWSRTDPSASGATFERP